MEGKKELTENNIWCTQARLADVIKLQEEHSEISRDNALLKARVLASKCSITFRALTNDST